MIGRRKFHAPALLLTTLVLATIFAACFQQPTPTPSAEKPTIAVGGEEVTITFACDYGATYEFEKLAQSFHQAHPDINVQVVSTEDVLGIGLSDPWPEDSIARLASAADVVDMGFRPADTQSGLIMDLQPLIESDRSFQTEDFYPGTLESFQWDGGTWALPAGVEAILIFYNKDLFDRAGVPYPKAGWTLEDFLNMAKRLTMRQEGEVIQWGFADTVTHVPAFLRLQGVKLVDDTTQPPVPSLDTPEVAQALRWYTDLTLTHGVAPPYPKAGDDRLYREEMRRLVDEGKVAMWTDLSINREYRSESINLGIVPFPAGKAKLNPVTTASYWMSAGTAHPQESWLWLKALTEQPPRRWPGTTIPARRSVAEETGFWAELDEETAAAYRYALDHAWVREHGWNIPNIAFVLFEATLAVLKGEKGIEEALAEAQQRALQEMAALAKVTPHPVVVATPKPAAEGTTITFVSLPTNLAAYRELAQAFHQTHPDITVEVKSGAGLREMAESGDCFSWLFPHVAEERFRQYVLNLQPLLESDDGFPLDDFYPQALNAFRWQGGLWGLPADIRLKVIYYDQTFFDQAEVAYPRLDWNLDGFLEKAIALTHREGEEKQYGFVPLYEPDDLLFFVERRGGQLIDATAQPPQPQFDNPQMVEAVRWYADMILKYGVRPAPVGSVSELGDQGRYHALVTTGRAAMWMDFSSNQLFPDLPSDTHLAPLPQGEGGISGSAAFCRGYFISKGTPYPQACWEWLKFLSEQLSPVEGLPPRRSLVESAQFRAQVGEETARVYLASLERIDNLSSPLYEQLPWLKRTLFWFYQAFNAIMEGEDADSALNEAQREAEVYIGCLESKEGFADEEVQKACAKGGDPQHQESGK
jgi:multiple sugar transport system substrate-binding protein